MNFAGNFVRIGEIDITALQRQVLDLPKEAWQGDEFRQQRYDVHRDTQTVHLVFDPDFRHTHPTRLPALEAFEPSLRPALKVAADHFDDSPKGIELFDEYGMGYFVRANLVRLKPGGVITEHTDNNFSLVHSHRIHLPVVSNEEVGFTVGNETIHMKEGELWEINNRRLHSVRNDGPAERIHLILDYVIPGERCCCGQKLHPRTACNPQACEQTDHLKIECVCFQTL